MADMPVFHGSCLCGRVRFEVEAEPIQVTTCHCKSCKKATGTVFTTNVVFPAGSARFTSGDEHVTTFLDEVQDSGNALQRKFCGHCSSLLLSVGGDFGRTLAVYYSAFDDFNLEGEKEKPPQMEYYTKDRTSWVSAFPGAEQAKTKPGRDD
ncbi:Mss4-like protein [Flagelloscypha sp. PMI_526]|nr:Mss4-like protein [Flagelloscypha sp. PMI_526]